MSIHRFAIWFAIGWGWSHIRNKRTFRPNLQPVRTTIDGENVRVRVCVKCIKAGKVQRVEA
ncbi:MAG: L28 family ribosomal protein [Bifidobacterium pseudocatenulatum]|nr:L28 family ribosomal protein [Bifidobacterium pseudocatenulatum]